MTRTQEDGTVNLRRISAAIICSLALAASGAAFAMDLDELVAKAVEAQGGAAALKALNSQKATGKFMTQGMEIAYTMVYARPNQLRIDASLAGMNIVQCFDGAAGWSINPMSGSQDPQPMGDTEVKAFRLQADMDGPYVNWAAKGYAAEYMGQEDVEGTPAYRLRLDTKQDIVLDFWFDAESFLVLKQNTKMKVDQGEFETQNYPSDYRQQAGLTLPFSVETRQGDQVMTQITVETLEFDVPVDQAMFAMPAPAAAPAPGEAGK
jgi:outer membrane lipoprotein-sorting protein